MPHVIVKLWPGKSENQKTRLAEAITKDVMEILHYGTSRFQSRWKKSNRKIGWNRCTNLTFKTSGDRKSTRLNSSHVRISYAGFCLKKKNTQAQDRLA